MSYDEVLASKETQLACLSVTDLSQVNRFYGLDFPLAPCGGGCEEFGLDAGSV